MSKILITGHKNPDNDAIMSAVAYAWLKNQIDDKNEYVACALGSIPNETQAVLDKFGLEAPQKLEKIEAQDEKQKLILLDHNELSQTVDGIEHAEIVEILDHHRVADVQTPNPILFMNMPVGSTSTIVATRFQHYEIEPAKAYAAALLSAIMTDTVMLKSPTATKIDERIAKQLGEIVGEDPIEFGKWVFNQRGTADFTNEDIVNRDTKKFEIGDKIVYIGQFETVDKAPFMDRIPDIRALMQSFIKEHKGDAMVLLITDILEEGSQVLAVGELGFIEDALKVSFTDEGIWMPGVLSRKKQVAAPLIESAN
ncbi:MAG: manganese-dependent inorganic pyrophosphatase [Coriobacteriia bacterium]|nr:manganese-dependent inorganic pyrophosphatase [Coriobacteriia bacterium]